MRKAEFSGYIAKEISKYYDKGAAGFMLLLRVNCERGKSREELQNKRHQNLMIWKILSLFRLQKMLKLGASLSGKRALQ